MRGWVLCVAMFGPLAPASGQAVGAPPRPNQGAGAVLRGRITEAGDTVPVPGAEIELVGTAVRHWADNHGRFAFAGVPAGSYEVRVRVIGYQPQTVRMAFEDGGVADRTIALQRLPNALTEVRIEGRMLKVPARYEEVYRRAARGWGTFINRDEIVRRNPLDVKSLLYAIPGVMVNDRGIQFQRCQDNILGMSWPTQVYVDGVRMTAAGASINEALSLVPPTAIQAIEVYRGVSQIPAEFLDNACAVIAIWTRSY